MTSLPQQTPASSQPDLARAGVELELVQVREQVARLVQISRTTDNDDERLRPTIALIFTGVRTVNMLLARMPVQGDSFQAWWNDVLDVLAEELGVDL